jgi:hypothetical protein
VPVLSIEFVSLLPTISLDSRAIPEHFRGMKLMPHQVQRSREQLLEVARISEIDSRQRQLALQATRPASSVAAMTSSPLFPVIVKLGRRSAKP